MSFRQIMGLLCTAGVAIICGCRSPDFARPNWHHPGSMNEQQARAAIFDPFPDNDGGPKVEGGRPPTYSTPPSDVKRSQAFREGVWRVQP